MTNLIVAAVVALVVGIVIGLMFGRSGKGFVATAPGRTAG